MAQSNEQGGDELRKELERLYRCVVYDRIDDVDRMELWIKEVGIVVEKLSAIDRKQHELDARIAGIEEAHKEILDVVFTYRSKDPNFCDVDDVSRVSMSWKVDRIAKLKAEREAL